MKSFKNSNFNSTIFYFLLLLVFQIDAKGQEPDSIMVFMDICGDGIDDQVFITAETPPSFPGGNAALYRYLTENIKSPPMSIDSQIELKIYCGFTVDIDGSIIDVSIIRGVSKEFDSIAVKAMENMPKWIPGKMFNKTVKTRYVLPVRIQFEPLAEKANPVQKTTKVPNLISIPDLVEPDTNMEEEVVERVLESESELEKVPKVKIYPNPVQEELFYSVIEPGLSVSFQIIDMYGQKCKWGYLISTGSVDVSKLKPGFYVFQTIQNNKIGTSVKWIKI